MDKGKILGVIGGVLFFVCATTLIFYSNSDFDQNLINQLEKGTPSSVLMEEVDKETLLEESAEKKHLNGHIMDMKYWKNCNSDPICDMEYYTTIYTTHMRDIKKEQILRKQFINGKISQKDFLNRINTLKKSINMD